MIDIPGYSASTKIYESDNSIIYHAISDQDGSLDLLKVLKDDFILAPEPTRYYQEFEITRNLNIDSVISAKRLDKVENTLVLVFEYIVASPLSSIISGANLSFQDKLNIAVRIVGALGEIHAAQIIHKNINPSNILIDPKSHRPKIIDFGIATRLSREYPTIKHPNILEGTLAYIPPEQTGRLNRSVDYRSDYYSLGVTFYELFTGQLPFDIDNTMELLHCHIAKPPVPPDRIKSAIPSVISAIIMKLMEKSAEQRYQSLWGIRSDFQKCIDQLQRDSVIHSFPIATEDSSNQLKIQQKLYGCEMELDTLLTTLKRVGQRNSEMMLVTGQPGVGKSTLVKEVYRPLTGRCIYFVTGKFEQFKRDIPYSAVVDAFSDLVQQLLTESEDRLILWRKALSQALGASAQIIINMIPQLELIIGNQPAVYKLDPSAAENRFNFIFQKFVRVFHYQDRPLIIFLDDLQWADPASLKLIELILTNQKVHSLHLIGAYRDNEVGPNHPLTLTLQRLRNALVIVNRLSLTPLNINHVTQLVADILQSDPESVTSLANLVFEKTQGNPLFIHEFINTLHQENLLTCTNQANPYRNGGWHWDLSKIEALNITDNVVELMIGKIQKLPYATRQALCLAACIGNRFDLDMLALTHGKAPTNTSQDLIPALHEGLIIPLSDLEIPEPDSTNTAPLINYYRFSHDRIHHAAHELQSAERRQSTHLKIGRFLGTHLPDRERRKRIFEIVDHFNVGRLLIEETREILDLATLNLNAGKKAKNATAYSAALHYFNNGIECLPKDSWSKHYGLAFSLHRQLAEAEYFNGHSEKSIRLINLLVKKAGTMLEKASLYGLLVWQHTVLTNHEAAVQAGAKALSMLGTELPANDHLEGALKTEQEKVVKSLAKSGFETLLDVKKMTVSRVLVAMTVLSNMAAVAYRSNQLLFAYIATKMVTLSLQYGNAPESPFGYAIYGTTLISKWEDYLLANESCNVALKLAKKFKDPSQQCQTSFVAANFVLPWVKPLSSSDTLNTLGCKAGMEFATLHYVGNMRAKMLFNAYYQGKNLKQILLKIPDVLDFSKRTKNHWAIGDWRGYRPGDYSVAPIGAEQRIRQLLN